MRPVSNLTEDSEKIRQALEQAEALAASYRASARIQGMRVDGLAHEAAHLRHHLGAWQQTVSWRVTAPLRAVRHLMNGRLPTGQKIPAVYARLREVYQDEGLRGVTQRVQARLPGADFSRVVSRYASKGRASSSPATSVTPGVQGRGAQVELLTPEQRQKNLETFYTQPLSADGLRDLTPRILIIAELSLRQCAKYRVWQKEEQLQALGWNVEVVDWREAEQAMAALQVCTEVIFYRVPAFESVENLLKEARRLGLSPWWEVDDLIFSAEQYQENGNLQTLDSAERKQVLFGVRLFRKCLLSCDRAIASTRVLAQAMLDAGIPEAVVIENALDQQTIDIAQALAERGVPAHDTTREIRIVYGSGTKTHDADFRIAANGILAAMQADPRLTLHIIGDLTVPESFQEVEDRVHVLAGRDYAAYMGLLAQADITIAPLEATIFNDAKSNIKFLEAAVLKIPSVCSPRDAFLQVMRDGENGLLAEQDAQWRDAILRLAADPALRARIGRQAYDDVLARYGPAQVAEQQVLPVFGRPVEKSRSGAGLRVLCVNVYFSPRSFGGATFVAEEMVRRLQQIPDVSITVFTSRPELNHRGSASIRYAVGGTDVLGVRVPPDHDRVGGLDNERATSQFRTWLAAVRPDVVHFHATQGLGLGLLRACVEAGVPYVVTVHDAWWLCERQFMVKADGHYCFQEKINQKVCQMCVPEARHLAERAVMMRAAMESAAMLLSPSETHRQLFLANGISPERIRVNRNGFIRPARPRTPRRPGSPVRFGYVGGTEDIKGYSLVRRAFQALPEKSWELLVVDNKLNLGIRSVYTDSWKVKGTVKTVPAYTQESMDQFFDGIDVLLFPSQWKESYGLTVREALARDVWVIATAPGGQSEEIVDGVNGTLIPIDGRAETLQKAVQAVLKTAERLIGYVNPFKSTLATFEGQTAELEQVLRDVVETRTASARCLAEGLSAISGDPAGS